MHRCRNIEEYFELVRAGLFPDNQARILAHGTAVDWAEIYRLAEEQSVIGLVAAGLETLPVSERPPQEVVLQFIGSTLQLEQRNKAMNVFVAEIIELLRRNGVYCLLVKGQGIAQCYEKPLWRACGDVDLLLSEDNYHKAKRVLGEIAESVGQETVKNKERKHQEYQIGGWMVELHGTMHTSLARRIDKEIDLVQRNVFCGGHVRSWLNGDTQVFLPRADEDVIFVFTHILQHMFLEGVGLRQICDWCRLLWFYRDSLNHELLESRIRKMGLISEWKVFYNLGHRYLGLPNLGEGILFHDSRFDKKADRLMAFILEVGNFGHNREVEWSEASKRRATLIWHKITDTIRLSIVFPIDAPKFLVNYAWDGVRGFIVKQ